VTRLRDRLGQRLLVATHNAGKLEEVADLLADLGISVVGAAEMGLPEPQETGTTFVENARIKAHAAATVTGLPALADDSGISVAGLDGAPGVYTADWAETGAGRDFAMAMARVWTELENRAVPEPRQAEFCCTLALAFPDGSDMIFAGTVPGRIVWPGRGSQGHGYDPIFQPDGHDVTFGEMDRWAKNRVSHRARAFAGLVDALGHD
jgi:XTP/dITP diphosphohydrolase